MLRLPAPPVVVLTVLLGFHTQSPGQRVQELPEPLIPDVTQALPLDPARRAELKQAMEKRNYDSAETLLAEEVERNPKSPQLLSFLGNIFFLDGKYLSSASALKKAEALAPLDDRSRFILAMAYVALERVDWARPELERLARSDFQNALYPYWLSRLDYRDMNFASAITHARKALEIDPGFMKAYDNLGLCFEALGRLDEAVRAYQEAARLNMQKRLGSPWPSLNLGTLLLKLGKLEEAEHYLKESLELDPRFPKAHFQLALLLEKRSKYFEAIEELNRACAFDSSYAEPHFALGRIYQRLGDQKEAERAWAMFRKLSAQEKEKGKPRKLSR